ncbi:hypothetical protein SAMN02745912_00410 [Paramaledivibacter caminithermalis DSM 15212]|jgi:hypothetical protein|uniref:Uncharacterized protein n=1 Tax=Paramaledivibacter caminithermalis (strain DSM 15212 / CIP 107654 / DViRD3) TaxID=1121301 RepID=A0A1M6KI50_PARC5|nr:hypothetical protein SAMN02745912_00410 [Paramaledivibacter caminithermalis DSM 15212]
MADLIGGRDLFKGGNLILFLLLIILVGDCLCDYDYGEKC